LLHNASAEEAAARFIQNESGVWGGWLNKSAQEKLGALITQPIQESLSLKSLQSKINALMLKKVMRLCLWLSY